MLPNIGALGELQWRLLSIDLIVQTDVVAIESHLVGPPCLFVRSKREEGFQCAQLGWRRQLTRAVLGILGIHRDLDSSAEDGDVKLGFDEELWALPFDVV